MKRYPESCPKWEQKCKLHKTKTNRKVPVSSLGGQRSRWTTKQQIEK